MDDSTPAHQIKTVSTIALWLTGLAFAAIHIAFSGRYGFHRDELLSYSNAMHLDWCYVVYPPLTAWLARAELIVFGTNLMGYRLLPAVAIGMVSVLAGLIVRTMGGGRRSMLVAAVAAGIAGPICFAGCFFSYMSFDLLWWVLIAWATVELVRSQNARWWIVIGAGFGLGLLTKYTILAYAAGLLVGMLLTSNRRYFRSGWFWGGVALALVMALPVIVWQFQHHFVALAWMKSIHTRDMGWGRTDHFIPNQFWNVTSPVTVPLWLAGLWFLFRNREGKPFRIIGWMYVITLILFVIAKARDYYLAPAYPMLMAAGAVWGESWVGQKSRRAQAAITRTVWISLAVSAMLVFALTLPIAPIQSPWWRIADAANDCFNMEIGWPELVATVAQVRDSLPSEERNGVRVLAADEGEAGAVNMYGPAYGLKEAISGMNSNWLRGYGNPPPQTVIAVGFKKSTLDNIFGSCEVAARESNPDGVVNTAVGDRPLIYVCRNIREPWPEFWKSFQYYG
ncbi:MAG TPA: glycosyltransferase family 39 protein [Terracidiphilus sp.]|nr:glycosyltransferase family 39 protein [Terracidiphilus sp.]